MTMLAPTITTRLAASPAPAPAAEPDTYQLIPFSIKRTVLPLLVSIAILCLVIKFTCI